MIKHEPTEYNLIYVAEDGKKFTDVNLYIEHEIKLREKKYTQLETNFTKPETFWVTFAVLVVFFAGYLCGCWCKVG